MPSTLLIKRADNDGRLSLIPELLRSEWTIEISDPDDTADFSVKLARADAMISMNWSPAFGNAPRLRLLQLPGAGTDDITFENVPPHTSVCNVFEHEIGIAEYVLAAMLHWEINVARMDRDLRSNNWSGSYLCGPRHGELHGKTLGIIGFGHIGREVARRARAFGMHITVCTRTPRLDILADQIFPMASLADLLGAAHYVVVALPLDASTRGLIDAAQLAQMRRDGVIINVARGAIINEAALFEACSAGQIGGAIIDTWYQYPKQGQTSAIPSKFPFRELANVTMTPHASGWTDGLLPRRCRAIAENLNRLARDEPLINVVRAATLVP
jgi:phosphoglycerate dehydrogenase-like enzyme